VNYCNSKLSQFQPETTNTLKWRYDDVVLKGRNTCETLLNTCELNPPMDVLVIENQTEWILTRIQQLFGLYKIVQYVQRTIRPVWLSIRKHCKAPTAAMALQMRSIAVLVIVLAFYAHADKTLSRVSVHPCFGKNIYKLLISPYLDFTSDCSEFFSDGDRTLNTAI
jgi:hypothetical protein